MAILTYSLRAIGEEDIARALGNIERRVLVHNRRVHRILAAGGGRIRERPGGVAAARNAAVRPPPVKVSTDFKNALKLEMHEEKVAHRAKLRMIETEKRAELAKSRAVARERIRENKAARVGYQRAMGTGLTSATSKLAAVGTVGGAMLGVGGSVLAGAAVSDSLKLDEITRRLVVSGRGAGEEARHDPQALAKMFTSTALDTGIAPEQIAGGVQSYVTKTGDLDFAIENHKLFATVAQATGAAVEDVAAAAADLSQKMDIKSVSDMSQALATLVFQGKAGAFELKDMASQFPRIASAAEAFGVKGMDGVKQLGGFLQVARQATGSGETAAFAAEASFRQLTSKSKEMQSGQAFGGRKVQVFEGNDPTKPLRNFGEILGDIMSASRGNMVQLQDVFGEEGIRAVRPLISTYREASDKAGGGKAGADAGRTAVMAMLADAADVQGSYADVQRDASDVLKSTSLQLEIAMTDLKDVMATELMPIIRDLAPLVREMGPPLREVTQAAIALGQALADNPLLGLGAIVASSIALEIGKAQLASVLTGCVTPLVGTLGTLSLAAGTLAASFIAAQAYINGKFNEGDAKAEKAAASAEEVNKQARAEIETTGMLTPETRAKVEALRDTQARTLAMAQGVHDEGWAGTANRALNQFTGDDPRNLDQAATLTRTAASPAYSAQVSETQRLLAGDDVAKQMSAAAREIMVAAQKLGDSSPNRSDKPSGVKK
jgi:hypothetical protein